MDFGKFFGTAFAESGDKVEIPVESQPSNAVSFTSGYTQDYSLNITTDPRAKSISRTGQNYLFWAITSALGGLQRFGAPSWVGPDDNGGVPLAYPKGARVQQGNEFYVSLVPNNTRALTDSTAWAVATYSPASNAEALTGTAADLLLTPASLRYVLQNTSIGQPASVTVAGVTRYATSAETQAGVVTTAAVTPAGLKPLADSKANVNAPTFVGPVSVNTGTLGGQATALAVNRGNGTLAWSLGNYGDASLRLLSWDSAGANPVTRVVFGPQPATPDDFPSVEFRGSLSTTNGISTIGRVSASVVANETVSSTTRLSTAEEMAAGSASVAVSPARVSAWAATRYLPITNPVVLGTLAVSAGDSGLRWQDPRNGRNRFFTNALFGQDERSFSFNTCDAAGNYLKTAYTINADTGNLTLNGGLTIPAGVSINAPAPTATQASTIRIATSPEVNAGTATDIAVVPATLAAYASSNLLSSRGGIATGTIAVRQGAVNNQSVAFQGGWSGVPQSWALVTDGDQTFTVYTYDKGNTPTVRLKCYPPGVNVGMQISGGLQVIGGSADFTNNVAYAAAFQSTSRRSKKNIYGEMTADAAFARLSSYRAYWGSWKPGERAGDTGVIRPFFIADEVDMHAPDAVGYDDDGEPGRVDYTADVPTLVCAVNSLHAMVKELQAEVAELRNRR